MKPDRQKALKDFNRMVKAWCTSKYKSVCSEETIATIRAALTEQAAPDVDLTALTKEVSYRMYGDKPQEYRAGKSLIEVAVEVLREQGYLRTPDRAEQAAPVDVDFEKAKEIMRGAFVPDYDEDGIEHQQLWMQVIDELGIYPAAVNDTPRTEWQTGWNEAVRKATTLMIEKLRAASRLPNTPDQAEKDRVMKVMAEALEDISAGLNDGEDTMPLIRGSEVKNARKVLAEYKKLKGKL